MSLERSPTKRDDTEGNETTGQSLVNTSPYTREDGSWGSEGHTRRVSEDWQDQSRRLPFRVDAAENATSSTKPVISLSSMLPALQCDLDPDKFSPQMHALSFVWPSVLASCTSRLFRPHANTIDSCQYTPVAQDVKWEHPPVATVDGTLYAIYAIDIYTDGSQKTRRETS